MSTYPAPAKPDRGRAPAKVALSVIVPVHRDNEALKGLLTRLADAGNVPDTVVAASADDDACRSLCERFGARLVCAGRACRGEQLNLGAAAARGRVLWFLHADAYPPVDAADRILAAVTSGAVGGCFRFAFANASGLAPWLIRTGAALRYRLGGMAYGDQGLFATRTAFDRAGGFAATPLFEEVPLVHGLRRQGRFVRLDAALPVSARRWRRDGWWRRSLHNRTLALRFMLGESPERLAGRYDPGRNAQGEGADHG